MITGISEHFELYLLVIFFSSYVICPNLQLKARRKWANATCLERYLGPPDVVSLEQIRNSNYT